MLRVQPITNIVQTNNRSTNQSSFLKRSDLSSLNISYKPAFKINFRGGATGVCKSAIELFCSSISRCSSNNVKNFKSNITFLESVPDFDTYSQEILSFLKKIFSKLFLQNCSPKSFASILSCLYNNESFYTSCLSAYQIQINDKYIFIKGNSPKIIQCIEMQGPNNVKSRTLSSKNATYISGDKIAQRELWHTEKDLNNKEIVISISGESDIHFFDPNYTQSYVCTKEIKKSHPQQFKKLRRQDNGESTQQVPTIYHVDLKIAPSKENTRPTFEICTDTIKQRENLTVTKTIVKGNQKCSITYYSEFNSESSEITIHLSKNGDKLDSCNKKFSQEVFAKLKELPPDVLYSIIKNDVEVKLNTEGTGITFSTEENTLSLPRDYMPKLNDILYNTGYILSAKMNKNIDKDSDSYYELDNLFKNEIDAIPSCLRVLVDRFISVSYSADFFFPLGLKELIAVSNVIENLSLVPKNFSYIFVQKYFPQTLAKIYELKYKDLFLDSN